MHFYTFFEIFQHQSSIFFFLLWVSAESDSPILANRQRCYFLCCCCPPTPGQTGWVSSAALSRFSLTHFPSPCLPSWISSFTPSRDQNSSFCFLRLRSPLLYLSLMMHKHPPTSDTPRLSPLSCSLSRSRSLSLSPSMLAVFRAAEGKWMASALPAGPITQQLTAKQKSAHTSLQTAKQHTHTGSQADEFLHALSHSQIDMQMYTHTPAPPTPSLPFQIYISPPSLHPPPSTRFQTPGPLSALLSARTIKTYEHVLVCRKIKKRLEARSVQ